MTIRYSYIGTVPEFGEYKKIDDISSQFNGVQTTFNAQVSGTNTNLNSTRQCIISVNGVLQEPDIAYTIGANPWELVFFEPPPTGSTFFGIIAGNRLDTIAVSDGAVTTQKLADNSVSSIKIQTDAITNAKVANGAIGTSELIDGSVTNIKIQDNAITLQKIQDNAVIGSKLADNSITFSKLISSVFATVSEIIAEATNKIVTATSLVSYLRDNNPNKICHIQHRLPAGTAGGSKNSNVWEDAPINTVLVDTIGGVSITANQFNLPAGTYDIEAISVVYSIEQHQLRLRNITDSTTLALGLSLYERSSIGVGGVNKLFGRFTISGTKTIALQHRSRFALAGEGWGTPHNGGEQEVYRDILIRKVA